MKSKYPVPGDKSKQNHSHAKHMWMMMICCGLPIAGLLVIATIGISVPSLETFLLLVCPVAMVGMMYMMHRDNHENGKDHSSCTTENENAQSPGDINGTEESPPARLPKSGSLKA